MTEVNLLENTALHDELRDKVNTVRGHMDDLKKFLQPVENMLGMIEQVKRHRSQHTQLLMRYQEAFKEVGIEGRTLNELTANAVAEIKRLRGEVK